MRDTRGVFTKNFFGGVWGNRPPLMEMNLPKTTCTCSKYAYFIIRDRVGSPLISYKSISDKITAKLYKYSTKINYYFASYTPKLLGTLSKCGLNTIDSLNVMRQL